jgi:hypothetical protein
VRPRHIIVCGLPRSGSTLLYQMMRSAEGLEFLEREQSAAKSIESDVNAVTKRPKDIFDLDRILELNGGRKDVAAIITIRDPRSVVSSVHLSYPHQPFIGFDHSLFVTPDAVSNTDPGLLKYALAVEKARSRTDLRTLVLRYEDIVAAPGETRRQLAAGLGIEFNRPFEGLKGNAPSDRFQKALKGARDLDASRIDAWVNESPQRVLRQFRLAPQLFAVTESWGYEGREDWFDALAERHPSALDDKPGLVVGFFTDDATYRREARRLRASLERLALPLKLETVPAGDWLSIVRKKVDILRKHRRENRGPLLYIDVDAVVHANPWPYLNGIGADVAFAVLRDGRARSGTLLLADSPGAATFLEDWNRRLDASPQAWDQHPLNEIAQEQRRTASPPYTVHLLPPAFCYIFDRAEQTGAAGTSAVIEHLQASRDVKSRGSEKFHRRQKRIAEIEQMLGLQ